MQAAVENSVDTAKILSTKMPSSHGPSNVDGFSEAFKSLFYNFNIQAMQYFSG